MTTPIELENLKLNQIACDLHGIQFEFHEDRDVLTIGYKDENGHSHFRVIKEGVKTRYNVSRNNR